MSIFPHTAQEILFVQLLTLTVPVETGEEQLPVLGSETSGRSISVFGQEQRFSFFS